MERRRVTLNENQLRKIVLESVKRVLKEEGYQYGVDVDDSMGNEEDVKGKNWFANHGIVNWKSNATDSVKVYLTTTFLGNHRLAGKLGARWATGSQKRMFNAYTVDSNAILVVVNDTRNGKVYQAQITEDGPQMVCDANDNQINANEMNTWFLKHIDAQFPKLLQMTKDMCAQEDEFFNSKTSKTYDKFKNGYGF